MRQKLAASLNGLIDEQISDDKSKSEIVASMASAAGVEANTVHQILQGEILYPPLHRLAGFAEVLGVSADSLRKSAESDGYSYSDSNDAAHQIPIREVIPKEQYERLQRVKEELERALDS